jgi:hypothetical protein
MITSHWYEQINNISNNYSDDDEDDDEDVEEEPSHECQVCSKKKNVNDHKNNTPSWCKSCECIQSFRKL